MLKQVRNLLTSVISVAVLLACANSKEVALQAPPAESSPPSPETSTGAPLETQRETPPKEAPVVAVVPAPQPRLLCDTKYPPYVTTMSAAAGPTGWAADLEINDVNRATGPTAGANLQKHFAPQLVKVLARERALAVLSAEREGDARDLGRTRRVYLADLDFVARTGAATDLGAEVEASAPLKRAAEREGFAARTFGTSDGGRYLLLGTARGYAVIERASMRSLGVVATGSAADAVHPDLRESDMRLTVSRWVAGRGGGALASDVFQLAVSASGGLSAKRIVTVSSLQRPLKAVSAQANDVYAALIEHELVLFDPMPSGSPARYPIDYLPSDGTLASAFAVWRSGPELRIAVVFETLTARVNRSGVDVGPSFLRMLRLDVSTGAGRLLALSADMPYPAESVQAFDRGIRSLAAGGVRDLVAGPGGAIFALFPSDIDNRVYGVSPATGLIAVSQGSCSHFSVGAQP